MRADGLGIEHYQLVGAAEEESWSQVRVVVPFNENELKMRGMLAVVVRVEGQEKAAGFGVELLQKLVEKFQSEGERKRWEWIQETAGWMKEKQGEGVIVVVLPVKEKRAVYIAGEGEMVVEIERGGERRLLWGKGREEAISGWLGKGDSLLLGTEAFYDQVWEQLEMKVSEEKIEEAGTRITSAEEGSLMAAVVLRVGEWRAGEQMEEKEGETKGGGRIVRGWQREKKEKKEQRSWLNLRKRKRKALKLFKANKREWSLRLGMIFLAIFAVSVVIGAWRKNKQERLAEYGQVAEPIEYNLQEAEKLREVNPVRARSLVVEAQEMMEEQGERFAEGGQAKEWEKLAEQVETVWQKVSGERQLEAKEWLDLAVVKEGIKVKKMVVEEDSLWVGGEKSLLVVSLDDKSSQVVAGEEVMGGAVALGELAENGLVGKKEAVWQVEKETGKTQEAVKIEGIGLVDVCGYANNIYVLAQEGVFKYPGLEEGFGRRRRYLGAGEEVEVGEMLEMEIDGDIWVLGKGGEVERLSKGQKIAFSWQGLVEEWGEVAGLMADSEKGRVWVWDKGKGVLIEFGRGDGQYKYKWEEERLKTAAVVEWDGARDRFIVAEGSQLWVMEAKE